MSDTQQYDKVTVSSDGVTVDKRFEEDEFPVPAIAFELRSTRSETVTVVVVDRVPEDVAVEDLGFHPEYGSEYWTIDEDRITFERELEAGSEYTTVYGIRATGTEDVEQFLTEPQVESVDPPLDEADAVVNEERSDVVRDIISGDSDTVPGLDDDGDEDGEDVDTIDLADPNASGGEAAGDASGGEAAGDASGGEVTGDASDGDSGGVGLRDASADSLVGALAAEIRNGNVDEEDVKLLRKAFDVTADDSGSVDARIQRLQTDVADLLAYTDALEEFLDENGTGDEVIAEFRAEVESFESELREVRETASTHEDALSDVSESLDGVESSMSALEADVDAVLDDIDAVKSDVGRMDDTVDDVESTVEGVESQISDLESQVGDIDVGDVEADIDEINDEIEELKEWREQLSSVIGGS